MTDRPTHRPSALGLALACLTLLALVAAAIGYWRQTSQLKLLVAQSAASEVRLAEVLGEVTRIRLEQRAEEKGPEGLLAKLRAYAPALSTARTTAPDYAAAQKEMEAILRALETIGSDAWPFVHGRIMQLKTEKDFDELKWLLQAAVRVEHKAGLELLQRVLQGTLLPSPRLRWLAANELLKHDMPLAQRLLRQILETESARGVNLDRAAAYNLPIPDQAAASASGSGFFNFVIHYIRSGDPKIEETLLLVLGRTEHDSMTLQECITELGRRKSQAALEPIKRLYQEPPGRVENPLFLNKCLDAIDAIAGAEARPFFEESLRTASTQTVAQHIQTLLNK